MFFSSVVILFATLITCIYSDSVSPGAFPPHVCGAQLIVKAPALTPDHSRPSDPSTTTEAPTNCCFVIQETVSAEYWPVANVTYTTLEVNLTSITTLVTPYRNGTSTNVYTNVYTTNASFPVTKTLGNPIADYRNDGFYMTESDTWLRGTAVTTAGITM